MFRFHSGAKAGKYFQGKSVVAVWSRYGAALALGLLLFGTATAQDLEPTADFSKVRLLKSARKDIKNGDYQAGREKLFRLYDSDTANALYNYELGYSYYNSPGEKSPGLAFLRRASRYTYNPDTLRRCFYYIGELYQQMGQYGPAIESLNKTKLFLAEKSKDGITKEKVDAMLKICDNASRVTALSNKQVRVSNLGPIINSAHSEYAPIFNDQETALIFTGRKMYLKGNTPTNIDAEYFEDNYASHKERGAYVPPVKFRFAEPAPGTPKVHNSAIAFSPDQKQLFTFRDKKLWVATFADGIWLAPVLLNHNINFGNIQTSCCLSADGNTLYFTSDGQGTLGGLDIWYSKKDESGNWGPANNMGPTINTAQNEESPSLSSDGKTLYFSSKGHNSIGGYDIFMSFLVGNVWSEPTNMGLPINSTSDDLHFVISKKNNMGYFSSRRADGYGEADIYKCLIFERPEFLECRTLTNTVMAIGFDARASVDKLGMKQFYSWDFGDKTRATGLNPLHTYRFPGKYVVKLSVLDSVTGYAQFNEKTIDVDIKKVDFMDVQYKDTVASGENILLDASRVQFKKGKILHHIWAMGDSTVNLDSSKIYYAWETPGEHQFRYEAIVKTDTNAKFQKYCVTRSVVVLPTSGAYGDAMRRSTPLAKALRPRLTDRPGMNSNPNDPNNWFNKAFAQETGQPFEPVSVEQLMSGKDVALAPIFFDFDDTHIRPDAQKAMDYNMKVLDEYKAMTIKVVAHADARGKNKYNIGLSRKRAQQAVVWLRDRGFDTNRIVSVVAGGEEIPVNKCFDNVECSPEDHQSNRLVEFVIANNPSVE